MSEKTIFAVIGGDLRSVQVAKGLEADGFCVRAYGLDVCGEITCKKTLKSALSGADCIILPLLCLSDKIYINAPFSSRKISFEEVVHNAPSKCLLLGGMLPAVTRKKIKAIDYCKREELLINNAVVTAEGAIQTAMEEFPKTLHGSRCLVVGFGRIGKALAPRLAGLGAAVSVSARKQSDLSWIEAGGLRALQTNQIHQTLSCFDIVFNTVPAKVIGERELAAATPGTLFIDLASAPGGVDLEAACFHKITVIQALSLPGRVAPVTAGNIIKQTVLNIISQEGKENGTP